MSNLRKIEKPLALLSFLCLFPAGMSAQSIVKGVVTDPSGEPVIGATVKAAGSKLGVITDLDASGAASMLNLPSKSVTTPSLLPFTLTVAPMTGSPLGSVTTPFTIL